MTKFKRHEQAIKKIAQHILGLEPIDQLLIEYRDIRNHYVNHNGTKYSILHMKGLYGIASRFALKQPFDPMPFVKADSNGFPSELSLFKRYLSSKNPDEVRIALTVLYQYRLDRTEPDLSTSTITSGSTKQEVVWKQYERTWESFISQWRIPTVQVKLSDLHLTSKAGPNGPRALSLAHEDAKAVQDSGLIHHLEEWCKLKQNSYLLDAYNDLVKFIPFSKRANPIDSRLHFISEGGAKTRVIAICDYWSQTFLKGLHDFTMKILRNMQTDGAYSHNRVAEVVKLQTRGNRPIYCYDLTAATDRFPIEIQERVLKQVIGGPASRVWRRMLTDRNFYHPYEKSYIRYSVGQPMGILSSWSVFSLSHHAIIEYCGHLEGKKSFRDYTIIGDDVAIFSEPVAQRYQEIMTILGVEINLKKSIISTQKPFSAELAKRIFLDGVEYSPLPPDVIKSCCKDYRIIPQLISIMSDRGWLVSDKFIPDSNHFFIQRVTPWLEEWVPSKSEEILDLITSPIFLPPLFKGLGERWSEYSEEEILWTAQLVLDDMLVSKSIEASEQHIRKYPLYGAKPFNDWGVLPNTSDLGPELTLRHPLVRAYYKAQTELRSFVTLSRDQGTERLTEVAREVSHVIDPSINHYWSKERKKYVFFTKLQHKLKEALNHRVYFEVGPGSDL